MKNDQDVLALFGPQVWIHKVTILARTFTLEVATDNTSLAARITGDFMGDDPVSILKATPDVVDDKAPKHWIALSGVSEPSSFADPIGIDARKLAIVAKVQTHYARKLSKEKTARLEALTQKLKTPKQRENSKELAALRLLDDGIGTEWRFGHPFDPIVWAIQPSTRGRDLNNSETWAGAIMPYRL